MRLLFPLGLLGLLSLLILILIYILKPKYQERKISSSFIWKLSLRYKRKRPPWQWVQNSLLFILQILILTVLTIMLTQPAYSTDSSQEKIIILDGSASMLTIKNEKTRFDRAIDEILELAKNTDGKPFSLIFAGPTPSIVLQQELNYELIEEAILGLNCTFQEIDILEAVELAKSVLSLAPESDVILYSDHTFDGLGGITLKNMSLNSEWNASILDFYVDFANGRYRFNVKIASYGQDAYIPVDLIVDEAKVESRTVHCTNNVPVILTFDETLLEYKTAKAVLIETVDDFIYDNEQYLYEGDRSEFKVQLVSENPIFLFAALRPLNCLIDVHYIVRDGEPKEDNGEEEEGNSILYSGYDLYIFDGYQLEDWPTDGTVWILDLENSDLPIETGVSYILDPTTLPENPFGVKLTNNYENEIYNQIAANLNVGELELTKYSKILGYEGYDVIMQLDDPDEKPLLLTKKIDGVKVVIFAFDIRWSNFPVLVLDYLQLIMNLKEYSVAYTTEEITYLCGDTVQVNLRPDVENYVVKHNIEINEYGKDPIDIEVLTPGTYTIIQTLKDGSKVTNNFFVRIPLEDSDYTVVGPELIGIERVKPAPKMSMREIATVLAAAVLIIVAIEWGLQYRELL